MPASFSIPAIKSARPRTSVLSFTEEPIIPGSPFNASHQPGLPPSISSPFPAGSKEAALFKSITIILEAREHL